MMAVFQAWSAGELLSSVRSKIMANFDTVATEANNLSASAPTVTVAGMIWTDTANLLIKQRNSTNTNWVTVGRLGGQVAENRGSNTTLGANDYGKLIVATASFTQGLGLASTVKSGWWVEVTNRGTGYLTIQQGTSLIDGYASIRIPPRMTVKLFSTGSTYYSDLDVTMRYGVVGVTIAAANTPQGWTSAFSSGFPNVLLHCQVGMVGNSMGAFAECQGSTTTQAAGYCQKPATGSLSFNYTAIGY